MNRRKPDGFEQREALGPDYWKDKRWKKVGDLRDEGKDAEANSLVFEIRKDWGIE